MDTEDNNETVKVLLIEDNHADVRIVQELFKDFKTKTELYAVNDGVEALEFLNKKGKYENKVYPDLILLDLNLPQMDGFEVLKEIKNNDDLKDIPVIVLTTSNTETDILKAHKFQVNCFITKPLAFDEYEIMLQNIEEFWLKNIKSSQNTI